MAKYNFFISYCRSDSLEYTQLITQLLMEKGYTVWRDEYDLPVGADVSACISEAITNSDCFLPIITERYNSSEWTKRELSFALNFSKNRAQKIIPLVFTQEISPFVEFLIANYQWIKITTPQEIVTAIEQIDRIYGNKLKSAVLYEKLVEFKNIQNNDKIATTVCELINLSLQKWRKSRKLKYREMQNICKEIYRLYIELETYTGRYDEESKKIAHLIINTIDRVEHLLNEPSNHPSGNNLFHRQIYFASIAIRILYSVYCVDDEMCNLF